jgi:hypothetical protein
MDPTIIIIIVLGVLVVVLAGVLLFQQRQSKQIRSKFGPEYERAVEESGNKRRAETELQERERRVEKLSIRPLETAERERFIQEWRHVQAEFVDNPEAAIRHADALLEEVMSARGYPVSDFEQMAADISVDHPQVVQHYRTAHEIAVQHKRGGVETEDLRQAMIHYRALFEELVTDEEAIQRKSKSGRMSDEPRR